MKVELDLYSAAELDAFAAFCTACATARRAEPSEKAEYPFGLTGLINQAQETLWKNRATAEVNAAADAVATADQEVEEAATKPVRERGQPSPGKARRTKAEIAEDDAATADEENAALTAELTKADEQPNISASPEDRQDPNNPEPSDSPEDAAQDAADEAAETAATKTGLTLDDVRDVIGIYVKAYGMAAAQEDGPKIITAVCGEGKIKVSDIPEDKIEAVIAEVKKAGKENRYDRKVAA